MKFNSWSLVNLPAYTYLLSFLYSLPWLNSLKTFELINILHSRPQYRETRSHKFSRFYYTFPTISKFRPQDNISPTPAFGNTYTPPLQSQCHPKISLIKRVTSHDCLLTFAFHFGKLALIMRARRAVVARRPATGTKKNGVRQHNIRRELSVEEFKHRDRGFPSHPNSVIAEWRVLYVISPFFLLFYGLLFFRVFFSLWWPMGGTHF